MKEQGRLSGKFKNVEMRLTNSCGVAGNDALLNTIVSLIRTGKSHPAVMDMLKLFRYVRNGAIGVPVYLPKNMEYAAKIKSIIKTRMGQAFSDMMLDLADVLEIIAVRHVVNRLEIANELYHIVFGSINEELAARGIVAAPQSIPGKGRYFKCIELYA